MNYGGARVPATGGTCVRGHAVVGKTCTDSVAPLMPPDLTPIHNPICPWDVAGRWGRAFSPDSLTIRSNVPQLQKLGASPRPATTRGGSEDYLSSQRVFAPACSGDGRLRFVMRWPEEVDTSSGNESPRGLTTLSNGLETPGYLYSTRSLPYRTDDPLVGPAPTSFPHGPAFVPNPAKPVNAHKGGPSKSGILVGDEGSDARPSPRITPAHLVRNGMTDSSTIIYKTSLFTPRRIGNRKMWLTSAMEREEQVHGNAAHWG